MTAIFQTVSKRFWKFINDTLEYNLAVQAIILYLQIPHMVWAADLAFAGGRLIAGISTPLDFLLYGVDLIEWIAIANITLILIARRKKKEQARIRE